MDVTPFSDWKELLVDGILREYGEASTKVTCRPESLLASGDSRKLAVTKLWNSNHDLGQETVERTCDGC